jgi:hypothetical protein
MAIPLVLVILGMIFNSIGLSYDPSSTEQDPAKRAAPEREEKVSSYEISQIGTALNIGESPLPLGPPL